MSYLETKHMGERVQRPFRRVEAMNPAWDLYTSLEMDVLATRETLFSEIDLVSPHVGDAARGMLARKFSNASSPLIGELFPWMMNDLQLATKDTARSIASGWLAVYIYTVFLDDHLDEGGNISPEEFLAGSVLAKTGLLSLYKIVTHTDYEEPFIDALRTAARGQLMDAVGVNRGEYLEQVEDTAAKKNYLLMAAAYTLAASDKENAQAILQLTKSLLLPLQYLDDVCDWEEDLRENRTTTLFAQASGVQNMKWLIGEEQDRMQILGELIASGTLRKALDRTKSLLSFSSSDESSIRQSADSATGKFFWRLNYLIDDLIAQLCDVEVLFPNLPSKAKEPLIKDVDDRLKIITQQT